MKQLNLQHCCEPMAFFLNEKRVPIGYSAVVREYFINIGTSGNIIQQIMYCPWCGTKLPNSLRDEYFDILEKEYGIKPDLETPKNKNVPEEFKSDQWWRRRGL